MATASPSHVQGPSPARRVPRGVVLLMGLAAAVVVVAGMKAAESLVGPTFLALVVVITAHPLREWLARRLPSWVATTLCLVVIYALAILLAVTLLVSAARLASLLPDYQDDLDDLVSSFTGGLHRLGISTAQVDNLKEGFDLSRLTGVISSALSDLLGVTSALVLVLALVLFMAMDSAMFPRHLAAAADLRPHLVEALTDFAHGTRRYLVVSTVFGLIVAVLDTVALALLDVPAPLLWGLLAFLTNYIPNIGFVIGLVPPALLALLDGGWTDMLAVVAVYCILNLVIQSGIQPRVVGDSVGLSTTLTFVSLVFWTWVIGPLGAILAIPLSLLVRAVLLDADPASSWLRPLVTNRTDP
ncbi:MAG TPA: AI-2E family transporter [Nocardioides sp.]|uniref:AI-2E family transporter n=1 Tax=Nocardioides sp. TaxID=35761 RepID=UPI002E31B7B4|nr:AI-2E family transporter [Nocardioides sp.]HEX5087921.1 AI-2E family transporter [Nocardioides sp.]